VSTLINILATIGVLACLGIFASIALIGLAISHAEIDESNEDGGAK